MNKGITGILASQLTAKKKAKTIADAFMVGAVKPEDILEACTLLSDVELAIVIEALEGATRKEPALVNDKLFSLLVKSLGHSASRVQWEAARTIGNVAKLHTDHLDLAVDALLVNTTSDGTVVRWATAQALVAILRAGYTKHSYRVKLSDIYSTEQDEGVRGVYDKALRARD